MALKTLTNDEVGVINIHKYFTSLKDFLGIHITDTKFSSI